MQMQLKLLLLHMSKIPVDEEHPEHPYSMFLFYVVLISVCFWADVSGL